MTTMGLIENYSHEIDVSSIVFCIILSILIRFVLYFSTDKKFRFVKRAIALIFIGSLANIAFENTCYGSGNHFLLYFLRAINHFCFSSCLYLYLLYVKDLLSLKERYAQGVALFTRALFCVFLVMDMCSCITKIGFCYTENGWKDTMISFYNGFYLYGSLLLVFMIVFYNRRLIKTIRLSLICTIVLVALIMTQCAIENTNTYTSLTYIMPLLVVLITIHSNPIDSTTGAMSYVSFISYVERHLKLNVSMDFLVLQLKNSELAEMNEELGKVLATFWYDYYSTASFFALENDSYVLVAPRIESNGATLETMEKLFYEVFPPYYEKFNMTYKALGLPDMDFIHSGADIKHMVDYLLSEMGDNTMLIIDDKKKEQLKITQEVKIQLMDIVAKQDLDDERVLVYCQPVKNANTGVYDSAEALMRLNIPKYGIVSPVLVIPCAEQFGYIHTLTKIMINKLCKELKIMEEEGYEYKRVSVNVAASELKETEFCQEIIDLIKANGIDPIKIGIELTESQNEYDFKLAKEKISGLKEAGSTIYLDDYGTGYSNFERVIKLGFDIIKFDRSILLSAQSDPNIFNMIKGLSESFKKMNYQILFEGIETKEHIDICKECSADYLQGFAFSKPVPVEEVRGFFTKK